MYSGVKVQVSAAESLQASANLWAIYNAEAERYNGVLVKSWRGDMDGILIFSGLFSASLTAFLIESYKTLLPDTGDVSATLLFQITRQLAAISNNVPLLVKTAETSVPFMPTRAAHVCNMLWFISLSLSFACALLATFVKQWAQEFLHKSQMCPSPPYRARVVAFLHSGLRRFGMHTVVRMIPILLQASFLFFFAGLTTFLLPINHILMYTMIMVLALLVAIYTIPTVLPLIWLNCPGQTTFLAPTGFLPSRWLHGAA
ncbi:hypothetical protein C8J57DRAFT_1572593 [Mycena rebaudengoi]|nr:hypothetical protein C8J57DRAFT_1572593 [Mycena rebaudengoi]